MTHAPFVALSSFDNINQLIDRYCITAPILHASTHVFPFRTAKSTEVACLPLPQKLREKMPPSAFSLPPLPPSFIPLESVGLIGRDRRRGYLEKRHPNKRRDGPCRRRVPQTAGVTAGMGLGQRARNKLTTHVLQEFCCRAVPQPSCPRYRPTPATHKKKNKQKRTDSASSSAFSRVASRAAELASFSSAALAWLFAACSLRAAAAVARATALPCETGGC